MNIRHMRFAQSSWVLEEGNKAVLSQSVKIIWFVAFIILCGLIWAYFAVVDEVASGQGRVVPTKREQVIQSLEGGILADILVREDEVVQPDQVLARLDPTRSESNVEESASKYRAALASASRLSSEVNGTMLSFPKELESYPELILAETRLYQARRASFEASQILINQSLELIQQEVEINQMLLKKGAASMVEVIRLRRQAVDLQKQKAELEANYIVESREELARANAEINALSSLVKGRSDSLTRLVLRSPVYGIVKNIEVSTIGGVVPPNGRLMDIIPLDDQLMIEGRVSPRDIAFVHPGQRASVKITAYDYAIYGGLEGIVDTVSPDTMRDEAHPDTYFYRVFVRTEADAIIGPTGKKFPIVPGMIATVDIHTGSKSVFDYLIKPFNRAREALRER